MTDPESAEEFSSPHASIEQAASDWIERRDRGDWNADEQSRLDTWLKASLAHRTAFWRLEAAWDRAERLAALRPDELRRGCRPSNGRAPRTTFKFAAGLGVLIVVVGAAAAFSLSVPGYQTYATTIGGREILTLRDGSVIELNASTVVRLSDNSQERRVSLERGEAYFNIRHDAAQPFVVTVGNHRITDLGTKFSVRSESDKLQVTLFEGRAELDTINAQRASRPLVLMPGEVAVATADSLSVSKKQMRTLSDALGWRHGQVIFYHTTFANAVAEFNRYSRQQLIVTDPQIALLVVNGSFPTNGIDAFTQAAQQVFGLHVKHRGNEIVISR